MMEIKIKNNNNHGWLQIMMSDYMDEFTEVFNNSVLISIYNPSTYHLCIQQGSLYTMECIGENTIIGELQGKPCYIWEIKHNEYIIIDDELVLDVQHHKGNMLSHIREENMTTSPSNCYINKVVKKNGNTHFYLVSKTYIAPSQELVYNAFDFIHERE